MCIIWFQFRGLLFDYLRYYEHSGYNITFTSYVVNDFITKMQLIQKYVYLDKVLERAYRILFPSTKMFTFYLQSSNCWVNTAPWTLKQFLPKVWTKLGINRKTNWKSIFAFLSGKKKVFFMTQSRYLKHKNKLSGQDLWVSPTTLTKYFFCYVKNYAETLWFMLTGTDDAR
jgi:hypothetical protein